jgi:hypothetical protein
MVGSMIARGAGLPRPGPPTRRFCANCTTPPRFARCRRRRCRGKYMVIQCLSWNAPVAGVFAALHAPAWEPSGENCPRSSESAGRPGSRCGVSGRLTASLPARFARERNRGRSRSEPCCPRARRAQHTAPGHPRPDRCAGRQVVAAGRMSATCANAPLSQIGFESRSRGGRARRIEQLLPVVE